MSRLLHWVIAAICLVQASRSDAQNLLKDGDIKRESPYWKTECVRVEDYQNEVIYGGTDAQNEVAEIDDETCMYQDVPVTPGYTYKLELVAGRRDIAPNPCTTRITVTGRDQNGRTVASFADMDFQRANGTFSLTPVAGIPLINLPAKTRVKSLWISFMDDTPGFSGLGMIVDNISLTRAGKYNGNGGAITRHHSPTGRYKIIQATSIQDMEQQVSDALNKGWNLYGQLIIQQEPQTSYFQVLTR